jgi:copper(I)-binding protein
MTKFLALLMFGATAMASSFASAHDQMEAGMVVVRAWTPVTAEPAPTSAAVYMTIQNQGTASDRLVGALTPVAAKVEIRPTAGESKPVAEVEIDGGKALELSSAGPHLVLTGMKRPLHLHDRFKMALEFERTGRVIVEVFVEDPATPRSALKPLAPLLPSDHHH